MEQNKDFLVKEPIGKLLFRLGDSYCHRADDQYAL